MKIFSNAFGPSFSTSGKGQSDSWWMKRFGHPNPHGSKEYAMNLSSVFGCQRGIAESLSILPRHIIRTTDDDKREKEKKHSTAKVFSHRANPKMGARTFVELLTGWAMGWGNGYAEIQFEPGTMRVVALWPIPPDRVEPIDNGKSVEYKIKLPDGGEVTLPARKMFHLKGLTLDGISGVSILKAACSTIGLGQQLEEFEQMIFQQGIIGGGFVEVPPGLEIDAIANMRHDLEEQNSGLSNAHRFKFLYEGTKFAPNGIKLTDAEFVALNIKNTEDIARFYRMPLHKLGVKTSGGYSSIELFEHAFVKDTQMPWGARWEEESLLKLFTEEEDTDLSLKFNYDALLRGDSVARSNFYRTMVMAGIMSRNEARRLEDLPPVEGGDEILVPSNMIGNESDKEAAANERIQD